MKRSLSLSSAIAFLAIIISALPALAIGNSYIEDFTTTQYKDTLNTTAWWDTVAGELRLFPVRDRRSSGPATRRVVPACRRLGGPRLCGG